MSAGTATGERGVDALAQVQHAAHGGEGWEARRGTIADDLGPIWAECGVRSECGTLRAVLMHRPGPEVEGITDPGKALWHAVVDPARAREQHDALAALYRAHGVAVHELGEVPRDKPNAYFCRDPFCMTPVGAVVGRMASASRAGEERWAAAALARIGVPIVRTVTGDGTFEGADVVALSEDLVIVGRGMRTNRSGAEQVAEAFRAVGVPEVVLVEIPYGCGHIDGTINVVDRDLALVYPTQLSWAVYEILLRHGFRVADLPDQTEAQLGMALNMVPLAPGVVVMCAGNPVTQRTLERHGVEVLTAEVDELQKGAGAVHCMTGVLWRDGV